MSYEIEIDATHYVGAVKYHSQWRIFHNIISMWILNYSAYDDDGEEWRKGIVQVDTHNADAYCAIMAEFELKFEQIPYTKKRLLRPAPLTFVVDFDEKRFVDGWQEQFSLIEYIPSSWSGTIGNPYKYIPDSMKELWGREYLNE